MLENLLLRWGCPNDEYHRLLPKIFFCSMIERAVNPGTVVKLTPVWVGEKNAGKSAFGRGVVAPSLRKDYFGAGLNLAADPDELTVAVSTKWLVEFDEMGGIRKASIDRFKAWVSQDIRTARRKYAKHPEDFPAACSFYGTANGDKKFIPIDKAGESRLPVATFRHQCGQEVVAMFDDGLRDACFRAAWDLYDRGLVSLTALPPNLEPIARAAAAPYIMSSTAVEAMVDRVIDYWQVRHIILEGDMDADPSDNKWPSRPNGIARGNNQMDFPDIAQRGVTISAIINFIESKNGVDASLTDLAKNQLNDFLMSESQGWEYARKANGEPRMHNGKHLLVLREACEQVEEERRLALAAAAKEREDAERDEAARKAAAAAGHNVTPLPTAAPAPVENRPLVPGAENPGEQRAAADEAARTEESLSSLTGSMDDGK